MLTVWEKEEGAAGGEEKRPRGVKKKTMDKQKERKQKVRLYTFVPLLTS